MLGWVLGLTLAMCAFAQTPRVNLSSAFSKPVLEELKPFFAPSEGETLDLLKGDVISVGKVDSPTDKEQQMMLFVSGIHPRNCRVS